MKDKGTEVAQAKHVSMEFYFFLIYIEMKDKGTEVTSRTSKARARF